MGAGWGTRKPSASACQEAVTGGDFPLVSAGAGRAGGNSWGGGWGRLGGDEGGARGGAQRGQAPRCPSGVWGVRRGAAPPWCPQMRRNRGGKPPPCPVCVCECAGERHRHGVPVWDTSGGAARRAPLQWKVSCAHRTRVTGGTGDPSTPTWGYLGPPQTLAAPRGAQRPPRRWGNREDAPSPPLPPRAAGHGAPAGWEASGQRVPICVAAVSLLPACLPVASPAPP